MDDLSVHVWLLYNVHLLLSRMECPFGFNFLFLASLYIVLCVHSPSLPQPPRDPSTQVYIETFNAELELFSGGMGEGAPVISLLAPPYQRPQRPGWEWAQGNGGGT